MGIFLVLIVGIVFIVFIVKNKEYRYENRITTDSGLCAVDRRVSTAVLRDLY